MPFSYNKLWFKHIEHKKTKMCGLLRVCRMEESVKCWQEPSEMQQFICLTPEKKLVSST